LIRLESERLRATVPYLALIVVFVASRLLYGAAGVRFDATPLESFWQYPDPLLLRTDLLRTLLLFHAQPPLFPLLLGMTSKLCCGAPGTALAWLFGLVALALPLATYRVLRRFGLGPRAAVAAAAVYLLTPTAVLYEHWLFYTWPVALLFLLAVEALARYLERPRFRRGLTFFGLLAAVALTRSAFHLVFVVGVAAGLVVIRPRLWKRTVAASLLPLAIVCGFYLKNLVLFSSFSASSWMWLNISRVTARGLGPAEAERLVAEEGFSPTLAIPAFATVERYLEYIEAPAPTGEPVLDAPRKSTGASNYNHSVYLRAAALRRDEFLALARARPAAYVEGVVHGTLSFLQPPTGTWHLRENMRQVAGVDAVVRVLLYGQLPPALAPASGPAGELAAVGWFVALALVLVPAEALRRWHGSTGEVPPGVAAYGFAALSILYVAVVANLLDFGENERFRVMIEPLLFGAALAVRRGGSPAAQR
jgi:hypothetical protein